MKRGLAQVFFENLYLVWQHEILKISLSGVWNAIRWSIFSVSLFLQRITSSGSVLFYTL